MMLVSEITACELEATEKLASTTDGLNNVGKELGATAKLSKLLEDLIRKEVQRLEDISLTIPVMCRANFKQCQPR